MMTLPAFSTPVRYNQQRYRETIYSTRLLGLAAEKRMTPPCEHIDDAVVLGDGAIAPCKYCERELRKVREEREAILALIEETRKTWKDGDGHQMVEVLLARIRTRA